MTRQRVLDGLLEAVELARERADPTAMISAWREIGRLCGYYAPERVRIGVQASGPNSIFSRMSDGELLAIAEGGRTDGEA